jgi:Calcium-dependent channel, 7TM region, putative phosphate
MCTFALAPSSPLVAPAAFAYFCFCEPLLKRNLIFVYRPRYDDGGLRWIVVFDMIISALVVGQILLSLQMGLKNALGPGLIATTAIPATIWFQWYCKRKFDPAFENTALLRTSLIDGWDSLDDMTLEHRESHLRFLVDAHKAAYVPVCIAGTDIARQITAEPAVAVPHSIIDSDSEHSEPSLKPRRPSSQGEARSRAPSSEVATALHDDIDGAEAGLGWLESALEPEDLVGAFGIFRLSSQKSE